MKVADLVADKKNPRRRNKRAAESIQKSLKDLGAGRSILIDKHGVLIAGNGVAEAALKAGIEDVQIVESDGSKIIAVRRIDLDLEQDDKARQLSIADNRAAELAEWDAVVLSELAELTDLKPYFTPEELAKATGVEPEPSDPAGSDQSDQLETAFNVLVTCNDEAAQVALLERLTAEGYECRSLIA